MNKRDYVPTYFLVLKSLIVIFTTITVKQSLAVKLFLSGLASAMLTKDV